MHKNVWILFVGQALMVSMAPFIVMIGGLLGEQLAPSPVYATVPVAAFIVGTALATLPVTLSMQRFGRKPVFLVCLVLAICASIMGSQAITLQSFNLLLLTTFLLGGTLAATQQFRFAAMESVPPELMSKAASRVLLGGLVAAYLGPELSTLGQQLKPGSFQGSFWLLAGINLIALMIMLGYREIDRCEDQLQHSVRPWKTLLMQPVLWAAILAAAIGFAVMSLVMTATPLHMHVVNGHGLEETKWVIQSHVMAMFLPSLVFPWLERRFGLSTLLMLGIAAYLLVVVVAFTHYELSNYWTALVLLGLGWNFLFIGGTTLLPQSYREGERFRVQALNEFIVFGVQAVAAVGSGWLMFRFGWQNLLLTVLPLLMILLISLLIWWRSRI